MSTLSVKCQLCETEVDYDETRDGICIECLHTGFRLITYFEVHPEPETLGQPHENCVICKKPTRYWMADKHTPLCPTCAKAICGPKSKKKAVKYSPKDAKIDYNKHTVKLWDAAKDQSIVLTFEAIECLYKATK